MFLSAVTVAMLALVLPIQSHGEVVTDVATAAELQDALRAERRHIRLVQHIDASGLLPQHAAAEEGEAAMFAVSGVTKSVQSACSGKPETVVDLSGAWRPGMCLVYVPQLTAFHSVEHWGVLWLRNLYVLLAVTQTANTVRRALFLETNSRISTVYAEQITLETRPQHQAFSGDVVALETASEADGHVELVAADLNIEKTGTNTVPAVFGSLDSPVSLVNSSFAGYKTAQVGLVQFTSHLRVESCSFTTNVQRVADLAFARDSEEQVARLSVYTNAPLSIAAVSAASLPTQLTLDQSSAEALQALGLRPFLSLEDRAFVALRSEVLGPTALEVSPSITLVVPNASSPSTMHAAIAGWGVAAACMLVAIVAPCTCFLMRQRSKRSNCQRKTEPEELKPEARKSAGESQAGMSKEAQAGETMERSQPSPDFATVSLSLAARSHLCPQGSSEPDGFELTGASLAKQCSEASYVLSVSGNTQVTTRYHTLASPEPIWTLPATTPNWYPNPGAAPVPDAVHNARTPRPRSRECSVQLLEEALEHLRVSDLKLAGRWTVLSSAHRRRGGQALVQFVRDELWRQDQAVKFYTDAAAFEREAALYARPGAHGVMAAVVHMQPAGMPCPVVGALPAWIVLERGSSLRDWAVMQKPDFLTTAQVMHQVLQRLERIHTMGLVHRDVKPGNILFRHAAKVWTLIDFGCVVDTHTPPDGAHACASISCSLPYAPPEVVDALERREKTMRVHASLDIWAIGVVIWELLTETRVFDSTMTSKAVKDQLSGRVPLPWERSTDAECVRQLSQLRMLRAPVLACLSRNAAKRPSAKQLVETLNHIFSGVDAYA